MELQIDAHSSGALGLLAGRSGEAVEQRVTRFQWLHGTVTKAILRDFGSVKRNMILLPIRRIR
jgi:hypothetical protein